MINVDGGSLSMKEPKLYPRTSVKVLLFIMVFMLFQSGCSTDRQKAFHPLWDVYELPNDFHVASHIYTVEYRGEGSNLNITLGPVAYKANIIHPNTADETIRYFGVDYYVTSHEIAWDGYDDDGKFTGGTSYTKQIEWSKGGYTYSASTASDVGFNELDFLNTKMASKINAKNVNKIHLDMRDMVIISSGYMSTYVKDNSMSMSIYINTLEDGEARIKELSNERELDITELDGIKYYANKNAVSFGIYAMTKSYSYWFNLSVRHDKELPDMDFFSIEYVADVINLLNLDV